MSQEQIEQLRLLEQQLQAVVSQKQAFQKQLLEYESALAELEGAQEAYRIVGTFMIKKTPSELQKQIEEDMDVAKQRQDNFSAQEEKIRAQHKELQEQVMANFSEEKQDEQ